MNIKGEFTAKECEYFRRECNFTEEELAVFDLRVKGKNVIEIMFILRKTYPMSQRTIERRLSAIKRTIHKAL